MNALKLATLGYWIFPLIEGTKIPPEGMHWRRMASTDPEEITSWWTKFPADNIGIDLERSNLLVIDLDSDEAADHWDETWDEQEYSSWDDGRYPVVETRRGWHVYFRQPRPKIGNPKKHRLGDSIDVKGEGGFVVAPGSVIGGHEYKLVAGDLASVPVCPAWLIGKMPPQTPPRIKRRSVRGISDWRAQHWFSAAIRHIANAPPGHRNDMLNEWSYKLRDVDLPNVDIAAELLAAATAAGLTEQEARATIRSGLGYWN